MTVIKHIKLHLTLHHQFMLRAYIKSNKIYNSNWKISKQPNNNTNHLNDLLNINFRFKSTKNLLRVFLLRKLTTGNTPFSTA